MFLAKENGRRVFATAGPVPWLGVVASLALG